MIGKSTLYGWALALTLLAARHVMAFNECHVKCSEECQRTTGCQPTCTEECVDQFPPLTAAETLACLSDTCDECASDYYRPVLGQCSEGTQTISYVWEVARYVASCGCEVPYGCYGHSGASSLPPSDIQECTEDTGDRTSPASEQELSPWVSALIVVLCLGGFAASVAVLRYHKAHRKLAHDYTLLDTAYTALLEQQQQEGKPTFKPLPVLKEAEAVSVVGADVEMRPHNTYEC